MNIIDLTDKTKEELLQMAHDLEPYIGKLAPALGDAKLRDAVEIGLLKRQKKLETEATEQTNRERLDRLGAKSDRKTHPCPETVAIETSRKVYCTFLNMENPGRDGQPGADDRFFKGDKYTFHLFDGQRHVMPLCMIVSNPEAEKPLLDRMTEYWEALGYKGNHAIKQAKQALWDMSIPKRCISHRFEMRYNPQTNETLPALAGHTVRFQFTEVSDAPADAEFGLVIKEVNDSGDNPK